MIREAIIANFGYGNFFEPWDLHKITGINEKVIRMCLKKMANNEELHYYISSGSFLLRTPEQVNKERQKVNDTIDKYGLKNKKYIITK